MAMKGKWATFRIGGVVLAALLSMPVAVARPAATATPVPFPQAPASLPTEAEMQAKLTNLQGFMTRVDRFIGGVHKATEKYLLYVQDVKWMLAGCEVDSDTSGFEGSGFEELVAGGGRQCRGWVADFDQQARAYAARLDQAVAFQKLVQRVFPRPCHGCF